MLAAAIAAATAAIIFSRSYPVSGPPMRDFEAYYAAGAVWNAGGDPYSQAIWRAERTLPGVGASRYEALPFVAPPSLLALFGMIARLPFATAIVLWRAVLVLAICGLAAVTLAFAKVRVTPVSLAAIASAAIGFGPLTSALALGQLALPAMLFASLAVLWPAAGFFAWIQPNIGIALISQARTWLGAILFAVLCLATTGAKGLQQYVAYVHRHSLAEQFSAIQVTPAAIAYGFGVSAATASALGIIVALAAICLWLVIMRSASDGTARFCSTCALLPFAMPFFHEHDLIVLFVPAVVYAVRCERRLWPLAASGALFAGTDWLGLAQWPNAALQTLLLITALGCALIALREKFDARMLLVPAGLLAVIAVAASFAQAHPAPVWPDAMRGLPHDIASVDIASAWKAQQRATGLLAQEPAWAALRLLSLFGCGLSAAAIALSSRSPAGSKNPLLAPAADF